MPLPGGLWVKGKHHRAFAFRTLTGSLELAVAESGEKFQALPARVTAVLSGMLEHVGNQRPTWKRVHGLCVGDRQFLVQQLAVCLGLEERWMSAHCRECGEGFDFFLQLSRLPVRPGGKGYPFAEALTSIGRLRLRVPTGEDQEAVCHITDEARALRTLVRRLVAEPAPNPKALESLTTEDLEAMDAALEGVAPQVATRAQTECPACGCSNEVRLDPYDCLARGGENLYSEIHLLASFYKWSEADILALPRTRRYRYLHFADRARGMVS